MAVTITFNVAKLEPCTKRHVEIEDLGESDLTRWEINSQRLSLESFQTNYRLVADLDEEEEERIKNAFIATIFKAYCKHYLLELSVKDIWVAIAQRVGVHLNENAEKHKEFKS